MTGPLEMILLAVIQGLTEFLPISSSGHLVLAGALLGLREQGIATEVVLHLGTLGAVLLYFRRDLLALLRGLLAPAAVSEAERGEARRMTAAIVIGTIPIVIAGLAAGTAIETLFEDPQKTSIALLVTGGLLLSTLFVPRREGRVTVARGAVIGLVQVLALLPGLSRSGVTIAGGLYLGLRPSEAARFSFLLSIPAVLGAAVLKVPEAVVGASAADLGLLLLGFLVALAVGYLSIALLLKVVRMGRFGWFGVYCLGIGLAGLIWLG